MQAVDLSKLGMLGQMPGGVGVMPGGQMAAMQMPQMMQMGMGGLAGMMGGASGMPQGIMMNPMMGMQKPSGDGKDEAGNKPAGSMQNAMFGGGMPFMMAQVPSQMQNQETSSQTPAGIQMGMMGQFPGVMQMPQQSQMQGGGQGGMPMGYTMILNPEQARSMNPVQLQQLQMQMQMMMGKGMMPGVMQMPKNDQNDPSKK